MDSMVRSDCAVCGERTERRSLIYWCSHCNVPVWEETCPLCGENARYVASDIRPVFPQERRLVQILTGHPIHPRGDSVWYGGGQYLVSGKKLRLPSVVWRSADPDQVREQIAALEAEEGMDESERFRQRWVKANQIRYEEITAEAIQAIEQKASDFQVSQMFVSFSGGKDSTVTSDLVTRALGTPAVIHIYGDTTLEFPETYRYLERFRSSNPRTPVLTARNRDQNFNEMVQTVGPPSRVMRWCCTVFKTGAITTKIERTFPGQKRILSFQGIRRSESTSRNRYDRESNSPKITKQAVFSPIIGWLDYDVWLYILTRGIDFNDAYRQGYTRVGCWCCPNNSSWSGFLNSVYMPEQSKAWRDQLISFARQVGKPDPEEYVDQGGWKARQGGNGLEISRRMLLDFTPCAVQEDTLNFDLVRPITEELYELFRPFGVLDMEMGNQNLGEVFVLDQERRPIMKLQGRIGERELRVSVLHIPFAGCRNFREAELKIRCQLSKYQICLGCTACLSVCRTDAITLRKDPGGYTSYRIDDKKCTRCGRCINHYDGGCYMRDVIRVKTGGSHGAAKGSD